MTSNINTGIPINWQSVLEGVAQLDNDKLHNFTKEVVQLLLDRSSTDQKSRDLALVHQIYTIAPPIMLLRQEALAARSESGQLYLGNVTSSVLPPKY